MLSDSMHFNSVIVRFSGEIGIKKVWTRRFYERCLLQNVKNVLKKYQISFSDIEYKLGRIYIKTEHAPEVSLKLTRVFGVSSVSPSIETTSILSDVVKESVQLASEILHEGNSFAVRCRRVGQHSYSSAAVCQEVGKEILATLPSLGLRVDLENPHVTLGIEVRDKAAFVFTTTMQGAGGFPLGSQQKVVCLLSGGIDSPVASWLAMKRGCPAVLMYFDNAPFTDETTTRRALGVAQTLFEWTIGFPRRIYIVPHGQSLTAFIDNCPERLTCILCKRMMYRAAERIAIMAHAEGIVTGESIGEQASQTISNLRVLNEAADQYPIHRPLLGFDKTETEALARKIGTYTVSIQKAKACAAAPRKPATKAKMEEVKEAEECLDIKKMIETSIKACKVVSL